MHFLISKKAFSKLDEIKAKEYKEPDKVVKEYEEKNLSIKMTEEALEYLVAHGSNIEYGLKRLDALFQSRRTRPRCMGVYELAR